MIGFICKTASQLTICVCLLVMLSKSAYAQNKQTQFNGFGHLEFTFDRDEDGRHASFSIGEHDFFVNSSLSSKVSFIGEYVIRYNAASATGFLPSIERSLLKFNYTNNHSVIVGKVHTPVNYWNDIYHHGRVFFPVIDRPMSFSYFVPLHTLGLQLQGQNLGKLNFGYDFVIGNGISSTDVYHDSVVPSVTGSVHIRPKEGMRIGLSYYWDNLHENTPGVHSGHGNPRMDPTMPSYEGPVKFRLTSFSFAHFGEKLEFLNESGFNTTQTDSAGTAFNFSQFVYVGLNLSEKSTPYALVDYIDIADNDLHSMPVEKFKIALGYRYSFSYLLNIKVQLEKNWELAHLNHMHQMSYGGPILRVQFAYGF